MNTTSRIALAAGGVLFSPELVTAQQLAANIPPEQVVVTASMLNRTISSLSQSASVVTEVEIEAKGFTDLTEILRGLPGLEFKKAGAPGMFSYPKLRGFADSILVVIDGVKVTEPSQGNVGNLIGQLDPDIIERIEVLRGPQATIYGADSTAGVIAITTKSGNQRDAHLKGEYGSLNWLKGLASLRDNVQFGGGTLGFSLNFSKQENDGVVDFEYSRSQTFQSRLDYAIGPIRAGASFYQLINKFQYSELSEAYCCQTPATYWSWQTADPHQTWGVHEEVLNTYIEHQIFSNFVQKLTVGGFSKYFGTHDLPDGLLGSQPAPFNGFDFNFSGTTYNMGDLVPIFDTRREVQSFYRDRVTQVDYTLRLTEGNFDGVAGFEYLHQNGHQWGTYGTSGGKQRVYSYYALAELTLLDETLIVGLGARLDDYSYSWGTKDTYNAGLTYKATDMLTVYGNFGTSFSAPTMFQLYNPNYGSSTLRPASGRTYEAGVRGLLLDNMLHWNATYWNSKVDDVIIYDYTIRNPRNPFGGFGEYANAAKQETSGVEFEAIYDVSPTLSFTANYTYTEARNQDLTGMWSTAVQVAKNKGNLGISFHDGPLWLGANLFLNASRLRWAGDIKSPGYARLDLSARYQVFDGWTVYGRVENVLASRIIEEVGFKQPRIFAVAGLQYQFY